MKRTLQMLVVAGSAVALVFLVPLSLGYPNYGVVNNGKQGCIPCHGTVASSVVLLHLSNAPTQYEAGRTYNITLDARGPPVTGTGNNVVMGGFAVDASAGTLRPIGNTGQIVTDRARVNHTLTHTAAGNKLLRWSFEWTAPDPAAGPVRISYAGYINDINKQYADDPWNNATWVALPPDAVPSTGTSIRSAHGAPTTEAPIGVAALLVLALVERRRRQEDV